MNSRHVAVFISGHGSNFQIFLDNKKRFKSLFVVSNKPDAYGLTRALENRVESLVLPKPINWTALTEELERRQTEVIFLAGFMKILPPEFIKSWEGRLFNLHPSMLPKYKGLKAIERAYEAKDNIGVSIHHVVPEVDAGRVVDQQIALTASQYENMSLEEVTEKVHELEHEMVQAWIKTYT